MNDNTKNIQGQEEQTKEVINEIKEEYVKMVGHSIGGSQIYRLLKRHGYKKVMPRSRHPKKVNQEIIETSKKLTQWQRD